MMMRTLAQDEAGAELLKLISDKRIGILECIADAATFLASDMADSITGATL